MARGHFKVSSSNCEGRTIIVKKKTMFVYYECNFPKINSFFIMFGRFSTGWVHKNYL